MCLFDILTCITQYYVDETCKGAAALGWARRVAYQWHHHFSHSSILPPPNSIIYVTFYSPPNSLDLLDILFSAESFLIVLFSDKLRNVVRTMKKVISFFYHFFKAKTKTLYCHITVPNFIAGFCYFINQYCIDDLCPSMRVYLRTSTTLKCHAGQYTVHGCLYEKSHNSSKNLHFYVM